MSNLASPSHRAPPRPAVAVLVMRDDGRVLMVRRAAHEPAGGYWTPVTGKVEPGEAPRDAAVREVREETDQLIALTAEEVYRSLTSGGEFELTWYLARPLDADRPLKLDHDELSEARWLDPADALHLEPTFASTRHAIQTLLIDS